MVQAARIAALMIALAACKGDPAPAASGAGSGSSAAAPAAAAWVEPCATVLKDVPALADGRRVMAVINACKPHGDWAPVMQWNTPSDRGGPRPEAIEATLEAAQAFCTNAATQAFMGALTEARGKRTERPWRRLGELCQETISGGHDNRFASAPFFALDRIARAAAAEPRLAPLLAALDLPLPPWSVSGAGVDIAPSPVTRPATARVAVTVTQTELYVGTLPRATLGATGVTVVLGAAPYPGTAVPAAQVDARIGELAQASTAPIVIVAPSGIRAARVIDAREAIGSARTVVLGVAAPGAPPGWVILGQSGLALLREAPAETHWLPLSATGTPLLTAIAQGTASDFARPGLALADDVTAATLANILGALAYHDLGAVALQKQK